jgi:CBS domain-containing protein
MTDTYTRDEARRFAEQLGVAGEVDLDQLRIGMEVELEHGRRDPLTNVTDDDPMMTAKIALAHLRELPDYYTRLTRMEAAAEHPPVVADLMTADPITVRDRVPLITADRLMRKAGVSGLPVVNDHGSLVGVVSRTDLMAIAADPGRDPWQVTSVASVMSSPAVTVRADVPVTEAAAVMEELRVHRLVVVDPQGDQPIGILSTTDLTRAAAIGSGEAVQ